MTDIPIYKSSLPECKIYADLESISQDLNFVIEITGLLIAGEKNPLLLKSLFSSALIAYRRCFNSGVRNGLKKDDLAIFDGNPIGMHEYIYDQANKLIAHSVNPFEHTQVGAVVKDERVIGITVLSAQMILFPDSDVEQWHRLAKATLEQILRPRIEQAKQAALEAIKKIPISQVIAAPPLEYKPATADQANKSR